MANRLALVATCHNLPCAILDTYYVKRMESISTGQIWQFRRRHWLIEGIVSDGSLPLHVEAACVDDDAEGHKQIIIPSCEVDSENIDNQLWENIGRNTPTDAAGYSAYLQFKTGLENLQTIDTRQSLFEYYVLIYFYNLRSSRRSEIFRRERNPHAHDPFSR